LQLEIKHIMMVHIFNWCSNYKKLNII
ncbi:hypothetical protein, partial [Plasmodium yoelii yoelii]